VRLTSLAAVRLALSGETMDENAYNPASAKKLLAEAGYPNGFKTNVVADTSRDKNGNLPDGT